MPKRVIDFDALWASDKLASCAEWAQSEYAWLYGLADASGSFELTNLRVIWGRVAAIRKNLSLERLQEIFDEFIACGLLFTWEENGKRYGHWTGSDMPGRLPARSWRARLQKLAPPVPPEGLAAYSAQFGGSKEGIVTRAGAGATTPDASSANTQSRELKPELEEAQAQDLGLDSEGDLEFDLDLENPVCRGPRCVCPPGAGKAEAARSRHSLNLISVGLTSAGQRIARLRGQRPSVPPKSCSKFTNANAASCRRRAPLRPNAAADARAGSRAASPRRNFGPRCVAPRPRRSWRAKAIAAGKRASIG